jgi:Starch-binding associating with outer membrane
MKKLNYIYVVMLISTLTISSISCKKYLDVNTNPNKPSTITLSTLLPSVEEATANNHYQVGFTACLLSQQLAAYTSGPLNDDQNLDVRMGGAFASLYANAFGNNNELIKLAQAQNAPFYEGVGKILMAINLGLATDVWGNIPYSKAFTGAANLNPSYDVQQNIYTEIQSLLSSGITLLGLPAGTQKPTSEDLIFGGSAAKWIKTANGLKARYYMHLTKKGVANSAALALPFFASALSSNADDCQLVYNDRNFNPWHRNIAIGTTTGNFILTHSKKFLDGMNGNLYPGLVDPRLPLIADKGAAATYNGIQNGLGTGGNTNINANTFFAKVNAPLFIFTYAEQKFLEAEANFLVNGGTATSTGTNAATYSAYLAGINANMSKLGVAAAATTAYVTNPLVDVTAANLKMEQIMREKFIVTYLHPETWVDVRRYDYNNNIYKGIQLPTTQSPAMGGQYIRRAMYPLSELTLNTSAQQELKPMTDKLWWDQ